MTTILQRFRSMGIVIPAMALLVLLCMAPASATGVLGAKYMGSISPGGTDTHIITIDIGAAEEATDMQVDVEGFGQMPSGVYSPLDAANDVSPYSARSFITLDKSKVHLDPGTNQSVTATIKLPQNAGPGGMYAIILVHPPSGTGKSISTAVLIPVFITVAGTTPTETGSILQVDTGTVTISQPITITTTLKNTGNYHYYHARNEVTVKDSTGALVANVSTTPMVSAIIPQNTVQFVAQPDVKNLKAGTYTVDSKVFLENGNMLDEKSSTLTVQTDYIPPATESSITVSPGSPATLTSSDGRISISFPQGAVLGDGLVTLKPLAKGKLNAAPANAKLGVTCFEISGLTGLLSKDATVTVTYSADDLAAAGGDASQLKLSYYDAVKNAWVILPTQVDAGSKKLTATTDHMGVFTVMVSSSTSAGSSAAGAPSGLSLPLPAVLSIIAIAGTAIIVRGTIRRRK